MCRFKVVMCLSKANEENQNIFEAQILKKNPAEHKGFANCVRCGEVYTHLSRRSWHAEFRQLSHKHDRNFTEIRKNVSSFSGSIFTKLTNAHQPNVAHIR